MARVKGGTPRSTPSIRFPAATAFTRSRGATPVKPSAGDDALERSASPAASVSRRSRSRSRSQRDDARPESQTIVATPVNHDHADSDDLAAQLLHETRPVSFSAAPSDAVDGNHEANEEEQSTERKDEEAQEDESVADVKETQDAGEPELAGEDMDEDKEETNEDKEETNEDKEETNGDKEETNEDKEETNEDKEETNEDKEEMDEDNEEMGKDEEENEGGADEGEFEVEKICSFQLAEEEASPGGDGAAAAAPAVLLEIKWRGYPRSANTLEPEAGVQGSAAAALLYKFWAARGGRDRALGLRPQTAAYVPFRVLKRVEDGARRRRRRPGRRPAARYLVQWLGYDVDQATPESEPKLRDVAPDLLDAFLRGNAADAANAGGADGEVEAFSPRFPE